MVFARIAVVTSDVFVRRLTPSLAAFVKDRRDFRFIDIRHPLADLKRIIKSSEPAAIVTEFLPKVTAAIVKLGYPTVIADTDELFPGAVSIDVDDHAVGEGAANFLLACGYRSFGCVHLGTPYSVQRLAGFKARLAAAGFASSDFRYPGRQDRPYMESWRDQDRRLLDWLRNLPKPSGLFAVHDPLGRSVCEAAMEAGFRIPDDIAVLGANNDELVCGLSYPPLSSVAIPWDRIGALAGHWAQRLLDHRAAPARPVLVPPGPVVVRQSTALSAVDDPTVRRVMHYFRENSGQPITVQSACSALKLSRRAVERKFARLLQSSPWEVLCRLRTETAKRLLTETDLSMSLISDRAGFGRPERFSIVFRRQTHFTPSQYRKKAARGSQTGCDR